MKEIKHYKTDYLGLLLEYPDGVTAKEIAETYFDDVPTHTIRWTLKRLHTQGLVRRIKDEGEYRYWITDKGVLRYDYLLSQQEKQ